MGLEIGGGEPYRDDKSSGHELVGPNGGTSNGGWEIGPRARAQRWPRRRGAGTA